MTTRPAANHVVEPRYRVVRRDLSLAVIPRQVLTTLPP